MLLPRLSLRTRLLAVAVLGVLSCTVALYGLGRILQATAGVRTEKARETATAELEAMRHWHGCAKEMGTRSAVVGMRGGCVTSPADLEARPPADLDEPIRAGLLQASERAAGGESIALEQIEAPEPLVLVAGATRTRDGTIAWVVYTVRPSILISLWRSIAIALSVATMLLVGTAVSTLVSVQRGAATLNASLAALAHDLNAPVPRPPVPELTDLADHIAGLAGALARAKVEQERLAAELAQRDRLAALGRVVAGVAHEVRNPLASIKLRVDLGRIRPDTPAQLAGELASVSEEVTRLDRLVADLLVVAGRRSGPRVTTALGALAAQRVALLAPWAGERRVRIEVSGAASAALDADAVARAIDNLVRNAVEASPAGGEVGVEVLDDGRGPRVRVLDQGGGVDDARAAELFEPFFTTKPEGTGLGLALSRAIATTHGGTLTYAREGGVTCFELTFPSAARGAGLAPHGGGSAPRPAAHDGGPASEPREARS